MAGLSQEQLSYKSGVSQSVISRFERGLAPGMTTERLIMIGAVLDLRLPLGFCPHDHGCLWSRILPVDYEHPPAKPRTIGLPVVDKHVRRRGAEIGRRYVRAIDSGALARGAETSDALRARITKEVDEERATSA